MVQVLPAVPTFGSEFGRAIGTGAGQAFSEHMKKKQQLSQLKAENEQIKKETGIDLSGIIDPDMRKAKFVEELKGIQKEKLFSEKIKENKKILKDLEERRGLEPGSLSSYESDIKLAEQISRTKEIKEPKGKKTSKELEKEKKAVHELLKETGKYKTEEELNEAAETFDLPTAKTIWQESKKEKPKSATKKLLETETAKGYIEAKKEIPKIQSTFENIKRLRELGEKLIGIKGFVKSFLNTESAAEYNTLAASLLDPIIKVFNPVGAVPVTKLNWIRDTFAPKASDIKSRQEGKINTLERLTKQAEQRNQQKIKLFEDFNGEPPESEILKFDNDTSKTFNDFVDNQQYVEKLKNEVPKDKILMLDPNGKPLHVDPNQKAQNGMSLIQYYQTLGAQLIE